MVRIDDNIHQARFFPAVEGAAGGGQTAASPDDDLLSAARAGFIKLFGKILALGMIIINRPENNSVSEGMGYAGGFFGSITYATDNAANSQKIFWQLYAGRKAYFLKPNGVMAWKVDAQGRKLSDISASDGDQDWIAAEALDYEKLAKGIWPLPAGQTVESFRQEVLKDLKAFWDAHIKNVNGRLFFRATDGAWAQRGDGREIYYASYPDPHFLRLFAKLDPAHPWLKLVEDVQALNQVVLANYAQLGAVGQNPMPAKAFVSVSGGAYKVENYYEISRREGVNAQDLKDNEADSIRFILRMGRAAILDGDPAAKKMLQDLVKLAKITDPNSAHIYAGDAGAPSPYGWNNTLARACYGLALLGAGETEMARAFFQTVKNDFRGTFFGDWDGAANYYYDQAIIIQVLELQRSTP
jgi:hypothetical protein